MTRQAWSLPSTKISTVSCTTTISHLGGLSYTIGFCVLFGVFPKPLVDKMEGKECDEKSSKKIVLKITMSMTIPSFKSKFSCTRNFQTTRQNRMHSAPAPQRPSECPQYDNTSDN